MPVLTECEKLVAVAVAWRGCGSPDASCWLVLFLLSFLSPPFGQISFQPVPRIRGFERLYHSTPSVLLHHMLKRKFSALTGSHSQPTTLLGDVVQTFHTSENAAIDALKRKELFCTCTMGTPSNDPSTNPETQSTTPSKKLLGLTSKSKDHESKLSAEAIRIGLFHEAKKYFVGYLPIASFLQTFLPWSSCKGDVIKRSKLVFHNRGKRRDTCGSFVCYCRYPP